MLWLRLRPYLGGMDTSLDGGAKILVERRRRYTVGTVPPCGSAVRSISRVRAGTSGSPTEHGMCCKPAGRQVRSSASGIAGDAEADTEVREVGPVTDA